MSVLSKPDILAQMNKGDIVIEPFNAGSLANTSYDVRLGKYFYRQGLMEHTQTLNPFWEKSLRKMYAEVEEAKPVADYKSRRNPFHNFRPQDLVILVAPGETILAHTIEFIGGRNEVTTEMRARSSLGRIGIAVCKCAGWGDVGYINRWTMEVTNFSSSIIPLPVGMRVAQIIFHKVTPIAARDTYEQKGKYQASNDIKKIMQSWRPENMLPKLYQDPDLGNFSKYY